MVPGSDHGVTVLKARHVFGHGSALVNASRDAFTFVDEAQWLR